AALAAKAATTTIPIVFLAAEDPVKLELVANLARPGGNVTGASLLFAELGPKQLGLLRELVPTAARIGLLVNPTNVNAADVTKDVTAAGAALGLQIEVVQASNILEIDAAFASLVRRRGIRLACSQACRRARGRHRLLLLQPSAPARHLGDTARHSRRL